MTCSKCDEPSTHSVLVREGDLPNPYDPKGKDKDKSGMYVLAYCDDHWATIRELL